MKHQDPRIDAYIEKSADFAKPIMNHLRQLVHQACPQVTETVKWSFPHFEYKGILCSMASFKQHCAFGFWKASLLTDSYKLLAQADTPAMGHFGQIKSLADLPADEVLLQYLTEAVKLNEENVKLTNRTKSVQNEKTKLDIPIYFQEALAKNDLAQSTFENFSYSNKKEYLSWLAEAKSEHTRNKRLETALEWIAEGKSRNWKYIKK